MGSRTVLEAPLYEAEDKHLLALVPIFGSP
jgi:hypothetical protein